MPDCDGHGEGGSRRVLALPSSRRHGSRVYHTGDCHIVSQVGRDEMVSRRLSELKGRWRECKHCSGEAGKAPSNYETTCPICGEPVIHTASHIRQKHNAGGESDA